MRSVSHRPGIERLVIGIAGRIGAGKTTAAKYLVKAHGFKYLRYSQVLTERYDGPGTGESLQEVGWRVMSKGLQRELNAALIRKIQKSGDYAIDGLRHPVDLRSLRKEFGDRFLLLYIDAPARQRFTRVKRRRRLKDMREFRNADAHPVEGRIPQLRLKADWVTRNVSSVRQFHRRLDRILGAARRRVRR
jgi:dephospho-CoA kinase